MVRRDDDRSSGLERPGNLASRCDEPAGARPVSVSTGAPSSRPAAEGETPTAEAGRRKRGTQQTLYTMKRARGPQHQVKPEASTDEQSERRAGHFAAKATSSKRAPERDEDLGGVRGAARVQGSSRNTRDPSAKPSSRLAGTNRPKAKGPRAQRKSDGVIVPRMAATKNAAGGKGHERGRVGEEVPQGGVISPLLSNIYLHVLDALWMRHSAQQCEEAERRIQVILARLGLELRPDKTRRVELYDGKQGFDFSRLPLPQAPERRDLGTRAQARVLPASPAVSTRDEADPAAGARCDAETAVPRGSPGGDRRAQPDPSGMGGVLPHRERRRQLQSDRRVRVGTAARVARKACSPSARRTHRDLDTGLLPQTSDYTACEAP